MPGLRTTACAAAWASSLNGPTTNEEKVKRGLRLLFWCTASSGSSLTGGGMTLGSSLLRLGPREMTYSTVRTDSERVRKERRISLWNLVESQSRANCDGTPSATAPSSTRIMWVSRNHVLKFGFEMVSSSSTSAFSQSSFVVVIMSFNRVCPTVLESRRYVKIAKNVHKLWRMCG